MPTILVVDDEPHIIDVLEIALRDDGMEVMRAGSGAEALQLLRRHRIDAIVSDIRMPGVSGVELLREAKESAPETAVILITAYATTETAIEALQHGACDYLTKPFKIEELRAVIRRNLAQARSRPSQPVSSAVEAEALKGQKLFQALHRSRLIGKSRKMLEVYRTIGTVSAGDSTILITGESGTGKELIARAVHEASPRKDKPFVSVNCGAFPETLLESELFGYMKGAFTGAAANRKGLFEAAACGSIFLDEIGEMTPSMQVKLLRVLQDKRLRPLGSTVEVPVDVRVIAATNQDLQAALQHGRFREDLYYRIAVINIQLPPLRERPEDIPPLACHFLRYYADRSGKRIAAIAPDAMQRLESYAWPGNVRELENTIERAVALETSEVIHLERLPESVASNAVPFSHEALAVPDGPVDLEQFVADTQRALISRALKQSDGNQTVAAQRLRLTKPSLRHKIQSLGIDANRFRRTAGAGDSPE
jgi:two-component system, NtrC family, response regulator PilR